MDSAPADLTPPDTTALDTTAPDTTPQDITAPDTAPQCRMGETLCDGVCSDLQRSPVHCGRCGGGCPEGNACRDGRCTLVCPAGQTVCSGACVTVETDALHCGRCGARCAAGARCEGGACRCPEGQSLCGEACVDTSTSRAHCGACGRACAPPGGVGFCAEGTCGVLRCEAGRGDCDGMAPNGCEVTLATSPAHCGLCGRACMLPGATASCAAGRCAVAMCATGRGDCDATADNGCEVDLTTSRAHCGLCGRACRAGVCLAGRCLGASSCAELHREDPMLPSGLYTLDPDGEGPGRPFEAWCDMVTEGGGWTLLATVTNLGDGRDEGNWRVSAPVPNRWEDESVFGTPDPTRNEDFRSPAFHAVSGRALMITHRNAFLLRTNDACLPGVTLRARMAGLGWECGGSASFTTTTPCAHACAIERSMAREGDTALLAGMARAQLFLKAGEADGAQDGNRDRVYLSTSYRDNVDYPTGLGAFCSGASCSPRTGDADVNDRSDAITPTAGTEFYSVWVR